ncbi:hypothetical protein H9P43_007054 [Blastocladiella emersonii ATCC 22665]|nr:hypothetical protein H9P43_007054 [Blastocladiella emersonii ATCC 22665]
MTCVLPDQLYTLDGALSPTDCAALVAAAETYGFAPAEKSLRPRKGFAFRDSGRIALDPHPDLAARLWRQLAGVLPAFPEGTPVGMNTNIRLYKYGRGQSFGQHYDESVRVAGGRTEFTLLVYLSGGGEGEDDEVGGGETVFYEGRRKVVAAVAPVRGRALIHRHGDACLLHEGAAVTKGVKYLLRSDLVFAT